LSVKNLLTTLNSIIQNNLCLRCGTCVGICPKRVLDTNRERGNPEIIQENSCIDCAACIKSCPGIGFDFVGRGLAPTADTKLTPSPIFTHGTFKQGYLAYSNNTEIRSISSSGGFITAFLSYLLETGEIDGALVIQSSETEIWRGRAVIARNKEQLIKSANSKYIVTPTNELIREIIETNGRYAVVGLPCQIQGIKKASLLNKKLGERIVLTIGLFCHSTLEDEALHSIFSRLPKETIKTAKAFIYREGKHTGYPTVIDHNNAKYATAIYQSSILDKIKKRYPSFPLPLAHEILNVLFCLYPLKRCLSCIDASSLFADISVGDPWMPLPSKELKHQDGYSCVIARNDAALDFIEKAKLGLAITVIPLKDEAVLTCNKNMAHEKIANAVTYINELKRTGQVFPNYNFEIPNSTKKIPLKFYPCFHPSLKRVLLRVLFSFVGVVLILLKRARKKIGRSGF